MPRTFVLGEYTEIQKSKATISTHFLYADDSLARLFSVYTDVVYLFFLISSDISMLAFYFGFFSSEHILFSY